MIKAIIRKIRRQPSLQDELTSLKLREDFSRLGRTIGLYSYGCFDLSRISRGTTIGRYCSFAPTARVQTRNHGTGFLGLSPYFYEPELGVVDRNMVPFNEVVFEDDVWVGANAVILPAASRIGRGAVIGAGAIVTRPVPAYAIVAGNPARVIKMRFSDTIIARIEETRWWESPPEKLKQLVAKTPELTFDPARYFARHGN